MCVLFKKAIQTDGLIMSVLIDVLKLFKTEPKQVGKHN